MRENFIGSVTMMRVSHQQMLHQVLRLQRDGRPILVWKRVDTILDALEQQLLQPDPQHGNEYGQL